METTTSKPLFDTFARVGLRFVRGHGAWLETENGETYLDFSAGIAVNSLGHAHPHLVDALTQQAQKVWHVSNLFEIEGQERLAQRLCDNSFAEKVFFTNSGAEALEAAIKTARRYHYGAGNPERYHIITFEGAFHGRTLATIAAGGQEKYLEGFGPKVEGFDQVPFGDMDALEQAIGPQTAAILLEPIQGEGGLRPFDSETLQAIRALCDKHELLLIFDEVQTGIGRTGKLFAYQWSNVVPDIMAVAKGIGGGFPLGACLATAEAAKAMTAGTHGTTYGGNPLAMAVGNAVLDVVLEPGFLDNVVERANQLKQGLNGLIDQFPEIVSDYRGKGLLCGLKCVIPNIDLIKALRDHKLLAVGAGNNVVRLLPPLTITQQEVQDALTRIEQACTDLMQS